MDIRAPLHAPAPYNEKATPGPPSRVLFGLEGYDWEGARPWLGAPMLVALEPGWGAARSWLVARGLAHKGV